MFNKHRKNTPPLTRFALVGAIAASIILALCGPVWAAYLSNWRFDPQRRQLEFTLPPGASPTYSVTEEPTPRLVVNISDTQVGTNVTELYPDSAVRKVSLKEVAPEQARIIIEFAPDVVLSPDLVELQRVGNDNSWLLRPLMARSTGESLPLSQPSPNLEVRGTRSPLFELPPESNEEVVVLEASDRSVEITVPQVEETVVEPPFPSRQPQELANIDYGQPLPDSPLERTRDYGQPLPTSRNRGTIQWPEPLPDSPLERSLLVLQEGDTLELVFPRGENIVLPRGIELQEVLLLRSPILDRAGRIVVPAKTPVIGGFESSRNGSRFIARALYFYGRTVPLAGRSDIIEGSRRVDARILAGASAAGGLALLLLTDSGLGLLGGAAAGAGAVYATSPTAVTLEPAEVVEIRLTDDLPQSVFLGSR